SLQRRTRPAAEFAGPDWRRTAGRTGTGRGRPGRGLSVGRRGRETEAENAARHAAYQTSRVQACRAATARTSRVTTSAGRAAVRSSRSTSSEVKRGQSALLRQALPEKNGGAYVTGPQTVSALVVCPARFG